MSLLTPQARTELSKPHIYLAVLVELDFKTGVERYWTGNQELSHEGETYTPVAQLGNISPIESSEDFKANGIKLTLHGLPSTALRTAKHLTASDYKARPARLIIALMSPNFQNVIHSMSKYYFMDTVDYGIDPEIGITVEIQLETEVRYSSRQSIRRYSDQDQKIRHPNDKAFEYLSYINSGVEVKWGTEGSFFK